MQQGDEPVMGLEARHYYIRSHRYVTPGLFDWVMDQLRLRWRDRFDPVEFAVLFASPALRMAAPIWSSALRRVGIEYPHIAQAAMNRVQGMIPLRGRRPAAVGGDPNGEYEPLRPEDSPVYLNLNFCNWMQEALQRYGPPVRADDFFLLFITKSLVYNLYGGEVLTQAGPMGADRFAVAAFSQDMMTGDEAQDPPPPLPELRFMAPAAPAGQLRLQIADGAEAATEPEAADDHVITGIVEGLSRVAM
jgi:hypothetical protein